MADIEYHLYAENNSTFVGQLTPQTHGIGVDLPEFQKVGHDTGTASFALPVSSPIIPTLRQVVRVKLAGSWWEAWRVTSVRPRPVHPDEEIGQLVRVELRSLHVDDERAVVQRNVPVGLLPAFSERVEGWMSPAFVESESWAAATVIAVQGWGSAFYTGLPSGWTDPEALWISDGAGDDENAPASVSHWDRHEITPAFASTNAVLQITADNAGDLYWNGHHLGSVGDWRESRQFELGPMTTHTQLLAVKVTNAADDGPPGGNPSAAIWTLRDGIEGPVLARSGTAVHVLPYTATAPTTSEGEALLNLFADAPNLASRSCTFTATVDSGGVAWPRVEMLSMQVGSTIAAHLRDRADVAIDFEHHPDGTFSAWVKGGRGSIVAVDLIAAESTEGVADPAAVNVNDLEWEFDDTDSFDALLVEHDGGYLIRPSPSGGETFGFLRVDGSAGDATAIADGLLAAYGSGLEVASLEYLPVDTGDWPGVAFDVWDVIPVPTSTNLDATTNQRVRAITLRITDDGPRFVIELGSLWMERVALLERRARSDGANQVTSAQRVQVQSAAVSPPRVSTLVIADYAVPTALATDSGFFQFPYTCRVMWLRVTAKTPSGTTTIDVRRNTATVATLSMGAADTADFDEAVDLVTTTTDLWDVDLTAIGGHTRLVVTAGVAPLRT